LAQSVLKIFNKAYYVLGRISVLKWAYLAYFGVFWAYCRPCTHEIEVEVELQQQYTHNNSATTLRNAVTNCGCTSLMSFKALLGGGASITGVEAALQANSDQK
jgi:hypothetical protein